MQPPYIGPNSRPILRFKFRIVDHKSDALRVSEGYISSARLIMKGSCGTLPNIIVNPEKNNPNAISIKLFGNKVLGPTKKLDTPQRNIPIGII